MTIATKSRGTRVLSKAGHLIGIAAASIGLIMGVCPAAVAGSLEVAPRDVLIPVQLAMGSAVRPTVPTRKRLSAPVQPQGTLTPDEYKQLVEGAKRLPPGDRKRLAKAMKSLTPEQRQQLAQVVKRSLAGKGPASQAVKPLR